MRCAIRQKLYLYPATITNLFGIHAIGIYPVTGLTYCSPECADVLPVSIPDRYSKRQISIPPLLDGEYLQTLSFFSAIYRTRRNCAVRGPTKKSKNGNRQIEGLTNPSFRIQKICHSLPQHAPTISAELSAEVQGARAGIVGRGQEFASPTYFCLGHRQRQRNHRQQSFPKLC